MAHYLVGRPARTDQRGKKRQVDALRISHWRAVGNFIIACVVPFIGPCVRRLIAVICHDNYACYAYRRKDGMLRRRGVQIS